MNTLIMNEQDNNSSNNGWNNWNNWNQNQGGNQNGNGSWQNGEWQNGDPLKQDPFRQRPTLTPSERLSVTAMSLAIGSLVTTVFMTVFFPLILSPISIVLAVISKGKEKKLGARALKAVLIAIVALGINIYMVVTSFMSLFNDPSVRAGVNQLMEPIYGFTVEQEIEAIDAEFGTDFSSLLKGDSSTVNETEDGIGTEGSGEVIRIYEGGDHVEDFGL